ncbi:MAG: stage III sporulation protein AE [Fusicatenibacter sp.]|nr:stage III sporulation protein AE [Fusicatenibacter sp.]
MKRKRSLFCIVIVFLMFGCGAEIIWAGNDPLIPVNVDEEEQEVFEDSKESMLSGLDLDQLEESVNQLLEGQEFSFRDTLEILMGGEDALSVSGILGMAVKWIQNSILAQKKLLVQLLVLVLFGGILNSFAGAFAGEQLSETSFFIVYLLLFALLLKNFQSSGDNLRTTLEGLTGFMRVLTPSYYLAVATSSGVSAAAMFYQMALLVIWAVEKLLTAVLLPAIQIYILMALVNHLSKEEFLSHMTELLESGIEWTMKSALGLLLGLQIIKSLIAPVLDQLRRTTIGKTASAIPGVGSAINAVTEMVIASAVLIRNCFGVTAMIVMLLAGIAPVFHFLVAGLSLRILAAISQPISDRRIALCLATVGKGYGLLLKLLLTVEVLFLLTIAILAGTFS